jgi:hypothetical protein
MNVERQRVRDVAQVTLGSVLVLILIRWLTRGGIDLFDAWTFVIAAVAIAAILYVLWPRWKGRRS